MKIIFFDICSIPLFLLILIICYSRRMYKGNANRLFLAVVFLSLFSAIADLGMEITSGLAPLGRAGLALCSVSSYVYMALRNATNAVLMLFLLTLTRTTSMIRKKWVKVAFCVPYGIVLLLLILNPFNHASFTVTAEAGYARGPLMIVFYVMALLYGVAGFGYCVYCRRYLPRNKWFALMSIYVLAYIAVGIQFFRPELMVEMFCTAIGTLVILFSVMRPEERMDSEVGMLSWTSYQSDLRNILLSGEHVQIIVIRMLNCREIRTYLGDHKYNAYLKEIAGEIRALDWHRHSRLEIYFERPGTIYLIMDEIQTNTKSMMERLGRETGETVRQYADMGVRFEPRICFIRVPNDLNSAEDILSLGHIFEKIDKRDQLTHPASEIVNSRTFAIETHMKEILMRAIREEGCLEMYYQPIYDVRSGGFHSAEALARIIDPEYGVISPSAFIPAAETSGLIIPLGEQIMERVFRFVSEHDLRAMGLDFIEMNLSVAQCMQSNLPETFAAMQSKYGVDPGEINLEITETTFQNISDVMLENVNALISMGYSFALDDYGIGYSSIQRVNRLPLHLIKIDKSMLDEIDSKNGRMIMEHTVRMMQSIDKLLVAEGAETLDEVEELERMDCDYIQGFYFSRPLPVEDFLRFINDHNRRRMA